MADQATLPAALEAAHRENSSEEQLEVVAEELKQIDSNSNLQ